MTLSDQLANTIAKHLQQIYGEEFSEGAVNEIYKIVNENHTAHTRRDALWSQRDILLITYGDSILSEKYKPLRALHGFLKKYIGDAVTCVHILPFFPYSSDDGFSVIDYLKVSPELGDWQDIRALAGDYDLMADLVINHVSRQHQWFHNFLNELDPGKGYFITLDPDTDLSLVVRPRSTPLLTGFRAVDGIRHVWTTFSEDQVDLDFRNPAVLAEIIRIFLFYLGQGIRIIRLDAIAFLWKRAGTSCLHLPETHEVVKLLRTIGDAVDPGFLLLTETNVPNRENLSYFGAGDEAHMVYQFSLPPLLLYTLFSGNADYLVKWLDSLPEPGRNRSYLNFTASHDGIGVRPLEGLLPEDEIHTMLLSMKQFGGGLSLKRNADGSESVYEINITYFDAMKGSAAGLDDQQANRFLCSQIIMMGLKGIPAFYIHSLLATGNDYAGMERTGRLRSINRRKYTDTEIESFMNGKNTGRYVFTELTRIMKLRQTRPAFHPDSYQVIHRVESCFVAFTRSNPETGERVHCISNISAKPAELDTQSLYEEDAVLFDLIESRAVECNDGTIMLDPYQTLWLTLLSQ